MILRALRLLGGSPKEGKRIIKRRHRLWRADVVIVSYPKSGRTWLAAMISHVYHQQGGVDANQIIGFNNFRSVDPSVPRIFLYHDRSKAGRLVTSIHAFAGKKVVLLLRDPRDVAVSSYFHHTRRNRRKRPDGPGYVEPALFDYTIGSALPRIIAFMQRWERSIQSIPDALIVRYEDLSVRPVAELAKVMKFIDGEFLPGTIERAVEFASFENLRRKEAERFFASERLHPGQLDDPDSFKVRRGKVGGYREHFSPEQLARIEAMLADGLPEGFGYRQPGGQAASAGGS